MNYNMHMIGKRLQNARMLMGLTQEYVARKIGISEKFLSQIECGRAGLSIETLLDLCTVLAVNLDYILCGRLSSERNPVTRLLEGLSPEQYATAVKMLRLYADAVKGRQ